MSELVSTAAFPCVPVCSMSRDRASGQLISGIKNEVSGQSNEGFEWIESHVSKADQSHQQDEIRRIQ